MEDNKKEFIKKKANIIHKAKFRTTIESIRMSLKVAQQHDFRAAVRALSNAIYELERAIAILEDEED